MTPSLWIRDVASFSLQLAVIIGAGAAIWRLLGVRQSVVTLGYWRVLLMACLLLPISQPWRLNAPPPLESSIRPVVVEAVGPALERQSSVTVPSGWAPSMNNLILAGLAAGILTRALWLMLAAFSLRRLRRTAVRLEAVPSFVRDAQARTGARADVYISERISGPITFGFRRPVVMLPPSVLSMDGELQDAIATHELLHVRRRDWLHVILEEVVRTVLWFHPAIWWLTGRIQLSREHVVDEAVIRQTQSRDRYVEALLAVALTGSQDALAPAPLFLRRRFLKRRVAHIFQETVMTTRRLIASVTVSACALLFVAVVAVRSFPLEARTPPQEARGHEPSTDPIQILAGGDHLLHGALPEYPRRAFEQRIEGDVVLDLSVDDRGEVSDARVVSGPEELRRASLESVLQWHYSPEALRSSATQVALRFRIPAEGKWFAENGRAHVFNKMAVAWAVEKREEEEPSPAGRTERQMVELQEAMQDPNATDSQKEEYKLKFAEAKKRLERIRAGVAEEKAVPSSDGSLRLSRIRTERVPRETASEIANQAGISIGDPITEATAKRIREIAKSIDEHLRVSFDRDHAGIVLTIIAP